MIYLRSEPSPTRPSLAQSPPFPRYELQQMWLALKICQSHTTVSKSRDQNQSVWRNFIKYLNYDPFNFLDLSALST